MRKFLLLLTLLVITLSLNAQCEPVKWPFAQNSIWNMPIDSNAVYEPAYLRHLSEFQNVSPYWRSGIPVDEEPIIIAKPTDTLMSLLNPIN